MTDTRSRLLSVVTKEIGSIITEADDPIDALMASELKCDSLHRVSIMVAVEEEFGIEIHDSEDVLLGANATLRDLLALVERKVAGRVVA